MHVRYVTLLFIFTIILSSVVNNRAKLHSFYILNRFNSRGNNSNDHLFDIDSYGRALREESGMLEDSANMNPLSKIMNGVVPTPDEDMYLREMLSSNVDTDVPTDVPTDIPTNEIIIMDNKYPNKVNVHPSDYSYRNKGVNDWLFNMVPKGSQATVPYSTN